jgi:hypothetical protein
MTQARIIDQSSPLQFLANTGTACERRLFFGGAFVLGNVVEAYDIDLNHPNNDFPRLDRLGCSTLN